MKKLISILGLLLAVLLPALHVVGQVSGGGHGGGGTNSGITAATATNIAKGQFPLAGLISPDPTNTISTNTVPPASHATFSNFTVTKGAPAGVYYWQIGDGNGNTNDQYITVNSIRYTNSQYITNLGASTPVIHTLTASATITGSFSNVPNAVLFNPQVIANMGGYPVQNVNGQLFTFDGTSYSPNILANNFNLINSLTTTGIVTIGDSVGMSTFNAGSTALTIYFGGNTNYQTTNAASGFTAAELGVMYIGRDPKQAVYQNWSLPVVGAGGVVTGQTPFQDLQMGAAGPYYSRDTLGGLGFPNYTLLQVVVNPGYDVAWTTTENRGAFGARELFSWRNADAVFSWAKDRSGNGAFGNVGYEYVFELQTKTNIATVNGTLIVKTNLAANTVASRSISLSAVTITANYTVTTNDYFVVCDTTSSNLLVTLPPATGLTNVFVLKNVGVNTVTITNANGSDTIDGKLALTNFTQNAAHTIQGAGSTKWWIQ